MEIFQHLWRRRPCQGTWYCWFYDFVHTYHVSASALFPFEK